MTVKQYEQRYGIFELDSLFGVRDVTIMYRNQPVELRHTSDGYVTIVDKTINLNELYSEFP